MCRKVYVLSVGVWSSEEIGLEHDLDKLLLTDLPISIFVCLIQHTLQEIVSLQHQLYVIAIITHYTTWSSALLSLRPASVQDCFKSCSDSI